jgi:hypothetical protein
MVTGLSFAAVAALVSGALVQLRGGGLDSAPPAPEVRIPEGVVEPAEAGHWTSLPEGPLSPRGDHKAVWTGTEVLVWGGQTTEETESIRAGDGRRWNPVTRTWTGLLVTRFADGAAFEPSTRSWRRMAPAPFDDANHTAVWTGTEMIVWGIDDGARESGASYHPRTDRWRSIAASPLRGGLGHSSVWTGKEMIVWGSGGGAGPAVGAAYDPSRDSWTVLPEAPLAGRVSHTTVWTGTEMIVWGGFSRDVGTDGLGDGAAYNPTTQVWRLLPPAPAERRRFHSAVWTGTEAIVWWGEGDLVPRAGGAAYDPGANAWRSLPAPPLDGRSGASAVWTGTSVIGWAGSSHRPGEAGNEFRAYGDGAIYDPTTGSWTILPSAPLSARCGQSGVWTGKELFVWGGTPGCGNSRTGSSDAAFYVLTR